MDPHHMTGGLLRRKRDKRDGSHREKVDAAS